MPAALSHSMMPISNSTLSKRRRFQPAITSYFNSVPGEPHPQNGNIVSHNHYAAATYSPTPVVPAKVQSSLMSVGMRVRKSVADGYKTQLALKTDKMMPPTNATEPTSVQPHLGNNSYAELAPFSGLAKSSQEYSADHVITDDGDAFSLPPSSQESVGSSVSFGQKRSFESDIFVDEDASENDTNGPSQDAPVARRILSPSLGQRRRILTLRGSMRQSTMDLDDFEEASFLRRREEVDADYSRMDCA
ncbi:hypothetical protein N7448_007394 [Penicillium atrosanguineum]|uniref:Uncharacterized protein n=1 Tax=Penicillium atrosanguineum TaxID=1132637 RepID=A0A9W9KYF9_9EURO|nr:uncharacterized protein N7443_001580 [Penicillium atrosanguineum]KAJ5126615.1 hypothetical protein N7448_007394 [Penicillium atrosanguineum]KAJ5314696.1 hypothetical protein N7443_001580 [Penicillium atrosanguineum]KAJ5331866.1 hypothetical protein N7476_001649 [Penicillium atrosanguineum]